MKYSTSPYLSQLIERNIREIVTSHNSSENIRQFLRREFKDLDTMLEQAQSEDPQEASKSQMRLVAMVQSHFQEFMMRKSCKQFLSINKDHIVTIKQVTQPDNILKKFIISQRNQYNKPEVKEEAEEFFKLLAACFESRVYMVDETVPLPEIIVSNIILLEDSAKAVLERRVIQESAFTNFISSIILNDKKLLKLFVSLTMKNSMKDIETPNEDTIIAIVEDQLRKQLQNSDKERVTEIPIEALLYLFNHNCSDLYIVDEGQEVKSSVQEIQDTIYKKQFTNNMSSIYKKLGI